jgi:hypothetical protein
MQKEIGNIKLSSISRNQWLSGGGIAGVIILAIWSAAPRQEAPISLTPPSPTPTPSPVVTADHIRQVSSLPAKTTIAPDGQIEVGVDEVQKQVLLRESISVGQQLAQQILASVARDQGKNGECWRLTIPQCLDKKEDFWLSQYKLANDRASVLDKVQAIAAIRAIGMARNSNGQPLEARESMPQSLRTSTLALRNNRTETNQLERELEERAAADKAGQQQGSMK